MKHHSYIKSLQTMLITMALLVSAPAFSEESEERSVKPLDGELLLPDDYNKAADKKCMTVCDQWGEDCIINPRTGTRKCRRVCKSFTEECF
ncbi:MAG: hypothetical protein ACI85N_001246 [Gammaproteobacteria bacterium]|jgi:hypothetical protein